jgi:hypothetical protein
MAVHKIRTVSAAEINVPAASTAIMKKTMKGCRSRTIFLWLGKSAVSNILGAIRHADLPCQRHLGCCSGEVVATDDRII